MVQWALPYIAIWIPICRHTKETYLVHMHYEYIPYICFYCTTHGDVFPGISSLPDGGLPKMAKKQGNFKLQWLEPFWITRRFYELKSWGGLVSGSYVAVCFKIQGKSSKYEKFHFGEKVVIGSI